MKFTRIVTIAALIFVIAGTTVTAESSLDDDFSAFGIKSIGIYTESYKDERVDDFEAAYNEAYMRQAVNTFRYTLCDYNAVTPKLMTPNYPLFGNSASSRLDEMVCREISGYAAGLDWKTEIIEDFEGGSLAELLASATADGIDAVLVTRYYEIEYYVPLSGYSSIEGYSTITISARVGKLQKGLGLLPAMELYDTKTGARLWYSAYYTGALSKKALDNYQTHADNAGAFFVEGLSPEEKAVGTMVTLTMDSGDFPAAEASGKRDEAITSVRTSGPPHLFWTDFPEYDFYGTLIGVGYSFSYIGDFPLYYYEYRSGYNEDEEPAVCGTAKNAMLHTLNFPLFAMGTKNISLEPGFYIGFMHTSGATSIVQNEYTDDDLNQSTPSVLSNTYTTNATVWGLTVGMDAALKYYLRFSDNFSAFIGGRGLIEMWLVNVDDDSSEDLYYEQKTGGLLELDKFVVNASVIAGLRFDTSTPLEIIAMLTPAGPGSGPMISLGCNWHGVTFEWTDPHARNTEVMMHW